MKFVMFFVVIIFVGVGLNGCTQHYMSNLPLKDNFYAKTKKVTAIAGILDRRGVADASAVISATATKLLVEKAQIPDLSGQLKAEDISLLLSQPVELVLAKPQLDNLQKRLGYRYVIVGEEGGTPATVSSYWDIGLVIPAGVVIIFFTIPIQLSQEQGVMHATRVLRVIDLEQAQIIGESYALLRDHQNEGEYTSGEITDGLEKIKLVKE